MLPINLEGRKKKVVSKRRLLKKLWPRVAVKHCGCLGQGSLKVSGSGWTPNLFQLPPLLLEVSEPRYTKGIPGQVAAQPPLLPALIPHKHRLLWLRVPTRSRREALPCSLMMGPGLQHTVASGARMLTQTHVASSCGLVSVARARRGEGGCDAGVHSVCPCYVARHFAGFLLTQAVKGKLFLLVKFCFLLTLSLGPLLLELWLCTRQGAPAPG